MQLEHEADGLTTKSRRVVQLADRLVTDDDAPGVGPVEAGDQVQQRALARARRTRQEDELAAAHVERDVAQRGDVLAEPLRHAFDDDLGAGHQMPTSSQSPPDLLSVVRPVKPSVASVGVVA